MRNTEPRTLRHQASNMPAPRRVEVEEAGTEKEAEVEAGETRDPCYLNNHKGHKIKDYTVQKLNKLKSSGHFCPLFLPNGKRVCDFVANGITCPFKSCNSTHNMNGTKPKRQTARFYRSMTDTSTDSDPDSYYDKHHHDRHRYKRKKKHKKKQSRSSRSSSHRHKSRHERRKKGRTYYARSSSSDTDSNSSSSDFF